MFLLKQDITGKGRVDKKTVEQLEFKANSNNKEYEIESIRNSAVYARESEVSHLFGLYYLVSWKSYPKDKHTGKSALAVQHPRKLVSIFYKNYSNKLTAIFPPIDLAPLIAKCTATPNINDKQMHGQWVGSMQKKAKY